MNEPIKITYQDEHLKSVLGIILTLQTIEHFVKKFDKKFSLEFKVEKYQDIQRRPGMAVNLQNNAVRDFYLTGLTRKWIDELDIHGQLQPVVSKDKNELTHWRELSFECGSRKLSIYPDGGLLNGWIISRNNTEFFKPEESDATSDILLTRTHDIKIDVTIENM